MHNKKTLPVVLVAAYRFQNFPIRTMHALLEPMEGVRVHSIFYKNRYTNAVSPASAREQRLFAGLIREIQPALVGLSVYSVYLGVAKRLTRLIRENSTAMVVWGGIHPTLYPQDCIAETDAICLGEGEGALAELVTALRDGGDYRRIANMWVNDRGRVFRNGLRPLTRQLDDIPAPAYARDTFYFVESGKIEREDPTLADPLMAVIPARGCPFNCSFCVNSLLRPLYRELGPFLRRRSVDHVIGEIRSVLALPGHRKRMVEFHDENFGTDPAWLDEFAQRYPREVGLPFKVQYNPKLIDADIIEKLAGCGLHRVKIGIEAGTDRIRNRIFQRPGKNSEIVRLANEIARFGVKARYDLILDNPYDTPESLEETLRFLLELPRPLRFNLYSLQYFPGYALTRRALSDGHIDAAEASQQTLEERQARNWAFRPRLFPADRRQMLQNVVWLLAYNHTGAKAVRRALKKGISARVTLFALNLEAVVRGRIQAILRRLQAG